MKKIIFCIVAVSIQLATINVFAQSIEAKLGGDSGQESFYILNSVGDTVVDFKSDGKSFF